MHYYSHNIGDYKRDTDHLSLLEHGVYRQLMDLYYLSEKPIPLETEWVFRRLAARTEVEQKAIQAVLRDFFKETPEGYTHTRCDLEIREYKHKAETARANGKRGGRPTKTDPVISGMQEKSGSQANHKPLTINHKPRGERGTRLPTDWKPTAEDIQFCKTTRPDLDPQRVADDFRDYWVAVAGAKGVKLDWPATWRGWVRKQFSEKVAVSAQAVTIPSKPGIDPALAKITQDALKAVAPPAEVREQMRRLTGAKA